MSEYTLIPNEALHGDEGSYLIPVADTVGYAAAALVEPWACVEAAYRIKARTAPRPGGRALVVNCRGAAGAPAGLPDDAEVVVLTDADPDAIARAARKGAPPDAGGSGDVFTDPSEQPGFDDVVFVGAGSDARAQLEAALAALRRGGHLCLLASGELPHEVTVDVGSVHYRDIRIVAGASIEDAYTANGRRELCGGGAAHFSGAAGPMGQMHVQRALEHEAPPRLSVVSDLAAERLAYTVDRLAPVAKERGVEVVGLNPKDFASPAEFEKALTEKTGGAGFDDLVLCAPVGALVGACVRQAAAKAVVNIFAGVPIGTTAVLDIDMVARKHLRIIGSSGSRWDDMKDVLDKVTAGSLNTGLSLGAIGGHAQTLEGLKGLKAGRFPGKTVVYPAVADFALTRPELIGDRLPAVAEKLGPGGIWTNVAEEAFLEAEVTLPT
jgi:threonine dehydrogenase-like Zn-dependent dehydrogenase